MLITVMHFNLLSIFSQVYTSFAISCKKTEEFRGDCDEISTGLSDTPEKTGEQIGLNWEQLGEIIIFIYKD